MGIGATTIPAPVDAGEGVLCGAITVAAELAALAIAVSVGVDAAARLVLRAETGGDWTCAVAATAAIGAGASTRGSDAAAEGSITAGVGLMAAIRCVRIAALRPFACVSNWRAASRVRQYPAAYTVSTAAQLAATRLLEIRPLARRLDIPCIVRGQPIMEATAGTRNAQDALNRTLDWFDKYLK
jgi:hypothetical protein